MLNILGKVFESVLAIRISYQGKTHKLSSNTNIGRVKSYSNKNVFYIILEEIHVGCIKDFIICLLMLDTLEAHDYIYSH